MVTFTETGNVERGRFGEMLDLAWTCWVEDPIIYLDVCRGGSWDWLLGLRRSTEYGDVKLESVLYRYMVPDIIRVDIVYRKSL